VNGGGSFSGVIQDGGSGEVTALAVGGGTLTLSGVNTYSGGTTVKGGTLLIENTSGSGTGTGSVNVNNSATLGGSGTIGGPVNVNDSATLAPGDTLGILNTGPLTFASGANYNVAIGGASAGQYDQDNVTGTVSLSGTLHVSLVNGFTPSIGQQFVLIEHDGTDAVSGTFAGLPEGSQVSVGGLAFTISYHGGDGNDVVLTRVNSEIPTFFSFDRAFRLGERRAAGVIDGDKDADRVVCALDGQVTVYDGRTHRILFRFYPFGQQSGGLSVALADVNHDGRDDLILSPQDGSGLVEVFSGRNRRLLRSFDTGLPGVRLAVGDVTGHGVPDLIVGSGAGPLGGRVWIFKGVSRRLLAELRPYGKAYHGEVYVAAGDLTGDGIDEVLTVTQGRLLRAFRAPGMTELLRLVTPSAHYLGSIRIPLR
jgi:autotransporter-associated beta strand protein